MDSIRCVLDLASQRWMLSNLCKLIKWWGRSKMLGHWVLSPPEKWSPWIPECAKIPPFLFCCCPSFLPSPWADLAPRWKREWRALQAAGEVGGRDQHDRVHLPHSWDLASQAQCVWEFYRFTMEHISYKDTTIEVYIFHGDVQGCTKRLFPGCVKNGWKNSVLLPAVGKQDAIFSPNFTQPGKCLLMQSCRKRNLSWNDWDNES